MAIRSIGKYDFPARDAVENFGGAWVTYWNWVDHLMFCAPLAFPFPPDMRFGDVLDQVLAGIYGVHPDFEKVDWAKAEWMLDGQAFTPDLDKGLAENGLGHKSVVRFSTPGLTGIKGTCT